ncbi:nucleoside hydrolase-like domain-containing protein [uncultured Ferrovibrio sp.]|jgi:hypothetical protein|uniref:nucleoside hydrolase-like domain-containing protein n=1 Tax=uncultured Ferrovibrio sp. TaxID=1576913 RepID=UPI00261E3628|nr:nucleoside hydrolase-like domain-containing protein [uncultured Ferrovibrio sp.]
MAKPRVLISTDIGGADPDDIQSMVHALLYSDKVNLVGLVSTPSKHGGRASDINKVIDAYAQDYSKLKTWSSEYPTPDYLKSIVKQGSISVAPSQGWSTPTEGSKAIIAAAKASSEPLWVLAWGSMTDVAQALHDDPSIASKIKLYSIGSWNTQQDPAARDYVYNNFKDLWWIENNSTFRGMYVNDSGAATNNWKMGDAQGHGALGDYFYKAMPWGLKMGDTPSLLYLLDQADDNNPTASSWGGSFVKTGHGPNYWTDNPASNLKNGSYNGAETVQKYQSEFYKDFATRLDHAKAAKSGGSTTPAPSNPEPSNPPPQTGGKGNPVTAVDDNYKTGVDQALYFNTRHIMMNDKGADGGLKVTNVPTKSAAGATITWGSDGTVKYTPPKGWQGKDSFDYILSDADGSTDVGTVFVQVGNGTSTPTPTQPAPTTPPTSGTGNPVTAVDDNYSIDPGKTLYFNSRYLTWNDKGADGGLKVVNVETKSAAGATITWGSDGTVKYTPPKGWQGKDSFDYTLSDADGSKDVGTIFVQVGTGTNTPAPAPAPEPTPAPAPAPSAGTGNPVSVGDDVHKTTANQKHYFNSKYLLLNDKGPDGGLHVTDIETTTAKGGTVTWNASNGSAIYTPKAGFVGRDSVEYSIADRDGSSDTGLIHFDVLLA